MLVLIAFGLGWLYWIPDFPLIMLVLSSIVGVIFGPLDIWEQLPEYRESKSERKEALKRSPLFKGKIRWRYLECFLDGTIMFLLGLILWAFVKTIIWIIKGLFILFGITLFGKYLESDQDLDN